jgi:hypothetical protein
MEPRVSNALTFEVYETPVLLLNYQGNWSSRQDSHLDYSEIY